MRLVSCAIPVDHYGSSATRPGFVWGVSICIGHNVVGAFYAVFRLHQEKCINMFPSIRTLADYPLLGLDLLQPK